MKTNLAHTGAAALLALLSTPAAAASPASQAAVTARINRPLTISLVQNLDFGTIVLGTGSWSGEVVASPYSNAITASSLSSESMIVSMSQAGAVTCGSGGNLTCSGTPQAAKYQLFGTSNSTVTITCPGFNLINGAASLAFTPNAPATVNIGPAGPVQGATFSIGGSITLNSSTPDGVYTGTFAVTANYQ